MHREAVKTYVYVMVRTDMPIEQILVQANHAAYESGLMFNAVSDETSSLVSLYAKNQDALLDAQAYLDSKGVRYTAFHEPSWGYGLTAIATEPLTEDRRKALKRYSLFSRKHVDFDLPLPGKSGETSVAVPLAVSQNSQPLAECDPPRLFDSQKALYSAMRATMQHGTQDVFAHGVAVNQMYRSLKSYLESGQDAGLPSEVLADLASNKVLTQLHAKFKDQLLPDAVTDLYQVWHDCGKPICQQGGHFPNHAEWSAKQWRHLFPDDTEVAYLMEHDMDFHLAKSDTVERVWAQPYAYTLYLTAWAEVYANAAMFGGMASDSFKIKRKRLVQSGKKAL